MRTLLFLLLTFPALGQLPSSGSLSIKTSAGSGRSVAQEVNGNVDGSKSLSSLCAHAAISPCNILGFYGHQQLAPSGAYLDYPSSTSNDVYAYWMNGTGAQGLSISENDGAWVTIEPNSAASPYHISFAFVDGNAYRIRICNVAGQCGESGSFTYYSYPGSTTLSSWAQFGESYLLGSWTASANGGYNVELIRNDVSQGALYQTGTSKQFAGASLTNGNVYKLTVTPINGNRSGTGFTSNAVTWTVTLDPPGVPKSPAWGGNLTSPNGMEIQWNKPTAGDQPSQYRLEACYSDDNSHFNSYEFVKNIPATAALSYGVVLTNSELIAVSDMAGNIAGHYFKFRVRAENAAGWSSWAVSASQQYLAP